MAKVPGTFRGNGDGSSNISARVEWDEDNPQDIFNCTNEIFHSNECNGECGSYPATEGMTELLNEQRDWARLQINPKVEVDGLSMIIRLEMVEEYIREQEGISEEEYDERFKLRKADRMRMMRESAEPGIREARLKAQLGLAKKPIIGPHGEILGG